MMFLFLLFLLPFAAAKCPAGFVYSSGYNTCYSVNLGAASWRMAETMCMRMGGHLASIKDGPQNSYIYSLVRNVNSKRIWIGAEVLNNRWMFSDGSPMLYENFQGQINDPYGHSVAAMYINSNASNGKWDIVPDQQGTGYPYICETPQCYANGTAPASLLGPNYPIPGMTYGPVSRKYFFGSGSNRLYLKDAISWCRASGGYLVSISNAYENTEVLGLVPTILGTSPSLFEIIIGYQSNLKGVWSWMDGNYATYQNWDIGEPFMSTQMFGTMNLYAGKWKAAEDFLQRFFLCEFLASNTDVCF